MVGFAKAIGANTDLLTAQSFIFNREPFVAVIISAIGDDVFTRVRQLNNDLEQKFYETEGGVADRIQGCLDLVKEGLGEVENLQIIIAVCKEDTIYIKSTGIHKCYLLREGKLLGLINPVNEGQVISGHLNEGDKVLLISGKSIEPDGGEDWEEDFIKKLVNCQPESLNEEVELFIRQTETPQPLATVLIDKKNSEKERDFIIQNEHSYPGPKLNLLNLLPRSRKGMAVLFLPLLVLIAIGVFYQFKGGAQPVVEAQPSPSPSATNVKNITDWPLFLSLDLIKEGFTGKKMSYSLGKILFLDQSQKTLVSVDLNSKTHQILAGSQQLGQASWASLNGDDALTFSEDKGVVKTDTKNQKSQVVIKTDPEWGKVVDIFAFARNIYLLDEGRGQIWKYIPTESGYSDKNAYVKSQTSLSGAKRIQIDFSVWVLKNSEIEKFTAGNADNFSVGGMDKPLGPISAFFMPEEGDLGYFLDPDNSRLVVLNKNGQYQGQFMGEKFRTADDLVVDTENKKIYLLEGNKIYQLEL